MEEELTLQIEKLKEYREKIVNLFAYSVSGEAGDLYDYDLYAAGAVNRAIAIINSFSLLLPVEPLGAMALIRIHLDTLIRVNAPAVVEDRLGFVRDVMSGTRLDLMKLHPDVVARVDLKNDRMTDSNLVKVLTSFGNNIKVLYDEYCEDIHLSGKTIEKAVLENSDGIHFSIGTNEFISNDQKIKAVNDMIYISDLFIACLDAYIQYKKSLGGDAPVAE
jgi:hypothetical protein